MLAQEQNAAALNDRLEDLEKAKKASDKIINKKEKIIDELKKDVEEEKERKKEKVKYMQEEFKDIKVLAVHVHGPGIIHTKGRTVESIEDMAGLKLRGPSRQANALLSSMGVTPVGMPVPQFPEQLSKGVVDGGVIPWEIVPPLKVHELATAHT